MSKLKFYIWLLSKFYRLLRIIICADQTKIITTRGAKSIGPEYGKKRLIRLYIGCNNWLRPFHNCITNCWFLFKMLKFINQLNIICAITMQLRIYKIKSNISSTETIEEPSNCFLFNLLYK